MVRLNRKLEWDFRNPKLTLQCSGTLRIYKQHFTRLPKNPGNEKKQHPLVHWSPKLVSQLPSTWGASRHGTIAWLMLLAKRKRQQLGSSGFCRVGYGPGRAPICQGAYCFSGYYAILGLQYMERKPMRTCSVLSSKSYRYPIVNCPYYYNCQTKNIDQFIDFGPNKPER